jgi:hypothetical protein
MCGTDHDDVMHAFVETFRLSLCPCLGLQAVCSPAAAARCVVLPCRACCDQGAWASWEGLLLPPPPLRR